MTSQFLVLFFFRQDATILPKSRVCLLVREKDSLAGSLGYFGFGETRGHSVDGTVPSETTLLGESEDRQEQDAQTRGGAVPRVAFWSFGDLSEVRLMASPPHPPPQGKGTFQCAR